MEKKQESKATTLRKPTKSSKGNPQKTAKSEERATNVFADLSKYQSLFKKAESLYKEDESQVIEYYNSKDKDAQYYITMIKKGTASDKINALNMLIQKNPARGISYLQAIMAVAKKKNRKQAEFAFVALRDLFSEHIL